MVDKKQPLSPEMRKWLKENAPADLQDDRLAAEPTLHYSGRLKGGQDIEPSLFVEPKAAYPPPPAETLSRSEYLRLQEEEFKARASRQPATPIRTWTGGTMPAVAYRTDYHWDEDAENAAAVEEVLSDENPASKANPRHWESDDAYDPGELEGLDDRPLWMADLDLTDDDIEDDIYKADRAAGWASAERLAFERQQALEHAASCVADSTTHILSPSIDGLAYGIPFWAPEDVADELVRKLGHLRLLLEAKQIDSGQAANGVRNLIAPHLGPEGSPEPKCAWCNDRPIKYKKTGWCSRCHEFQRTHQGELPPLRLTKGRKI